MLEFIINQTYTIDNKKVKCVEEKEDLCFRCVIPIGGATCFKIKCTSPSRKDGKSIILIEV